MTDQTSRAVTAGAQALHDDSCADDECGGLHGEEREAQVVLAAAVPLLLEPLRMLATDIRGGHWPGGTDPLDQQQAATAARLVEGQLDQIEYRIDRCSPSTARLLARAYLLIDDSAVHHTEGDQP